MTAAVDHVECAETIRRLQDLLTNAIKQREHVISLNIAQGERIAELLAEGRHWFVSDGQGYCLACATPIANRRHCPRRSAA